MFKSIKYMGRYQDEEQLKTGRLPEAAIKYEEPGYDERSVYKRNAY